MRCPLSLHLILPRRVAVALFVLCAGALPPAAPAAGAGPLHFHLPDGGAPPWLYLSPGRSKPEGVVADILETAARTAHRELRYEFLPREKTVDALRSGTADGALFFSVTRPPGRELVLTEPLARLDTVLVTPLGRPLNYRLPSNLREQRLCTLTEELYPPLALLSMKGTLRQTRAKTEQAALMMLRFDSCVAAVVSGPTYRWMASRYAWDDLRTEAKPLLTEDLVLGFAARDREFAEVVNHTLKSLRDSGELGAQVDRWLSEDTRTGMRDPLRNPPRVGIR